MARRGTTNRSRTSTRARTTKRRASVKKRAGRRWVRHVMETSNAMDLPLAIFKRSSKEIARGLKQSVLRSNRTKGSKYQSAMSMLNLYINRTGKNLAAKGRKRLEAAKDELRRVFRRQPRNRAA